MFGSPCGGATALGNLGLLFARRGHNDETRSHFQQALDLCLRLGYASGEAGVHNGLGEVALATGEPEQALDLYTIFGVPEADETRAFLSDLGQR